MKKTTLVLAFALATFTTTFAQEKYYRPITKQEKAREKTAKPCEFVWNPIGEQLISDMAVDYQNALFVANLEQLDNSAKEEMVSFMKKYPEDFGIRSTQAAVISAIDQLESSFDLIKDTIIPSGLKQEGFFYDPTDKPEADSLMADLRKDPTSVADYKGKYYEVWHYKTDSSEVKMAMVFTPLGFEKINILHREEANIKTDYSELKNQFTNAEEQREEIKNARKEYPLDYGLRLGEEYQWNLSDTWRDIVVKPLDAPKK